MSDLIGRQAAIGLIDAGRLLSPYEPMWSDNEVVGFLKRRPSIDAEPVVRCKDCKWWKSSWKYCHYIHFDTDKNFYCAVGERRPDATFK